MLLWKRTGDDLKLLVNTSHSHVKYDDKNIRTTREYTNAHGQLVKTEHFAGRTNDDPAKKIVSKVEMDVLGRTWVERSPMNVKYGDYVSGKPGSINPLKNRYNSQGWVLERNDPDAGKMETLYDKLGNVRFFRDGNLREQNKFLVNVYDNLNRLTYVFIVEEDANNIRFTRSNAYNPTWPLDEIGPLRFLENETYGAYITLKQAYYYDIIPPSLPEGLTEYDFKNYKGRLTSTSAYVGTAYQVRKFLTYDYKGRVKKEWIKIMRHPLQCAEFEYDISGQIIEKKVFGTDPKGADYSEIETYTYDEFNRLSAIKDAFGAIKAKYTYWPDGKIRYYDYGKDLKHSIVFQYDNTGRLLEQAHLTYNGTTWSKSNVYEQQLFYNSQGNIIRQDYRFSSDKPEPFRSFIYTYDDFNRLTSANYGKSSSPLSTIDLYDETDFDGVYSYNIDGALTGIGRRGNIPATYNYKDGSHQLKSITGLIDPNGIPRNDQNNYQYDKNGNIVVDKALCRKIDYDYRNLPVRIRTYNDAEFKELKTSTAFIYDEAGNRVLKYKEK